MRSTTMSPLALTALLAAAPAALAADLPFDPAPPAVAFGGPGDGYRVARWPARPSPSRFDAYGYPIAGPVIAGGPSPLAVSGGCPMALEPVYDGIGNFAGYAPIPFCR